MAKVLIIGLDGATWRVLGPWARDGRLPNLAVLMARGSWGPLRSTVPALTLPAWSSLATGRNPGGHGVFAFRRLRPARYDSPGLASASDLRAPTLWEIAGRAGVRVGVVNVPPSYPIRPVNGFVVSCLLTPPGEPFAAPPEVAGELDGYRIDVQPPRGVVLDDPVNRAQALAYLEAIAQLTRGRTRATLHLARSRPTDLLAVVFYAPDRVPGARARPRAWAGPLEPGTAAIWIHVADRYPQGCVASGREYESVRDEVATGLRALRGPDGEPVFAAVHRRETVYRGAYVPEAPDLVAVCEPRYGVVYHSRAA